MDCYAKCVKDLGSENVVTAVPLLNKTNTKVA